MAAAEAIPVDEAVERIGLGRFQLPVLIATGLTWSGDAMEMSVMACEHMLSDNNCTGAGSSRLSHKGWRSTLARGRCAAGAAALVGNVASGC